MRLQISDFNTRYPFPLHVALLNHPLRMYPMPYLRWRTAVSRRTSQQKSVPTEPDADPVEIKSEIEGEQENKLQGKFLKGRNLHLLTMVLGLPSFSPPSRPPLSVLRWFGSPNALNGFLIKVWDVTA
ncbi:uncharacterized protein P174DRAFT_444888 [Aspergillus novofumigatus IBT 16806]|uniref:Uncharacterized protein n=1 Tax=Aspergillus novofumigatus (strain IBT 16806) TaxID=1392255 RepID=A0A2I1C0E8_ASPN1|nr:uncharacterized protein P174DRAFT_444888 [Aspergillus novofumigatus IBT 16806]PKX91122.1 hypothetical protein P174DRAFT_444888 [Aspergillus novofumigatus IBT 16806]